jgi:hypothetical protein
MSGMNRDAVIDHQQPMSFGEGVDSANAYFKYLGPGNNNIRPNAYDKLRIQNHDLPDKYKGENLFLRDTIDGKQLRIL